MIAECQTCRIGGIRIYDEIKWRGGKVLRRVLDLTNGVAALYQNVRYGVNRRVHNLTPSTQTSKGYRVCTVCGTRTSL